MGSRYDQAGARFGEWVDRHIDALAMTILGVLMLVVVVAFGMAIYVALTGESECPPGTQQVWVGEDVVIVDGIPHYIPQFECWVE